MSTADSLKTTALRESNALQHKMLKHFEGKRLTACRVVFEDIALRVKQAAKSEKFLATAQARAKNMQEWPKWQKAR